MLRSERGDWNSASVFGLQLAGRLLYGKSGSEKSSGVQLPPCEVGRPGLILHSNSTIDFGRPMHGI